MNRRVLTWSVLLAISALLIIGIQGSNAQEGDTGRFKQVEVQTTQYVWDLISNQDGRVICQAIVNHPNRPSNEETIQICANEIFPPSTPAGDPGAPRPTPVPFNLADFFRSVTWRFIATQELTRTMKESLPPIVVNITVPPGQSPPYHAIIAAHEPVFGQHITSISGVMNGTAFTCPSARCKLPVNHDASVEFWATSSYGDDSRHMQAVLVIQQKADKTTTLELTSLYPATMFRDSCGIAWGLPQTRLPEWSSFPVSPEDLNTMKPYEYLSGKLLAAGVVDASECLAGGMTASGAANSCGVNAATQAVVDWQNHYDVAIWESGRSLGVPPKLIKSLIAQESQFWPGNSRHIYNEYGLGQISQSGADVALRWDNDLFGRVCSGLVYDCSKIYGRLSTWMQATMRGGLVRTVNAECATCPHGIDEARAYESIPVITRTLRSNCLQVNYLMKRYRGSRSATYEDFWRYTLVSYHSGYQCLQEALFGAYYNNLDLTWNNVSGFLGCAGSQLYVNEVMNSLETFEEFRLKTKDSERPASLAEFKVAPTATHPAPTSTPTPVPSFAHIRVLVYVDSNKNQYPDANEEVEGIRVNLTLANGQMRSATTENGMIDFDLTGQPVNSDVTVALPELYRSQKVRVMRDGEIPVIFRLEQPVVPPALP